MVFFGNKIKKNSGFSLLEVMLVILILVTVFVPLLQILSGTLVASGEAKGTGIALKIAQAKLEEEKNTAYVDVITEAKAAVAGNTAYQREVIVSTPQTNLKDVRVIVYWFTPDGSEISIEVSSLVTNL
jgi:prepilin-type N-terminal cleavage/methylation domain-containing protein